MEQNEIVEMIRRELPGAIERNPELTDFVLRLTETRYARKAETSDRFYELLGELRRDREEQAAYRAQQDAKWEEYRQEQDRLRAERQEEWKQYREEQAVYRAQQDAKWEQYQGEQEKLRAADREEWEQYKLKLDELRASDRADWERYRQELQGVLAEQRAEWKQYQLRQDELRVSDRAEWERYRKELQGVLAGQREEWKLYQLEQEGRWAEQREKWKEEEQHRLENQKDHERLSAEAREFRDEMRQSVGAMGARWGTRSEKSFRNALKGILEEHFPIRVLNVSEFDEDGIVFGRPATIELDLIIKDGLLIICEIKSSVSVGDAFVFAKKAAFYEERHNKKADKLIMISPMVEKKARDFAKETGIKIYTFAHEIEPEIV